MVNGSKVTAPQIKLHLKSDYYTGNILSLVFPVCPFPFILGNFDGCSQPPGLLGTKQEGATVSQVSAALTRGGREKEDKQANPLTVSSISGLNITPDKLIELQTADACLTGMMKKAESNSHASAINPLDDSKPHFILKKGALYRTSIPRTKKGKVMGGHQEQLVVPLCLREQLLQLAHEGIFSGHLGVQKTYIRLSAEFYWNDMISDVSNFCAACDKCQKIGRKPVKSPLGVVPLIREVGEKMSTDLIGPLPVTTNGNRYILTLIDFASRYPMAKALRKTDSQTLSEALLDMFADIGIPRELLSDNGSNFVSELMHEVTRLLSIKQVKTSLYNPRHNGCIENLNKNTKNILRKLASESPQEWDRYLMPTLFAIRSSSHESLGGFSPFEMIYGRTPRSPLSLVKHAWTSATDLTEKTTYQHVFELANKLEDTCRYAHEELSKAKGRQKSIYDRTARDRTIQIGNKVLLLMPTSHSKMSLTWKGPYTVLQKVGAYTYRIQMGNKKKLFHINLLKEYVEREKINAPNESTFAGDGPALDQITSQTNDHVINCFHAFRSEQSTVITNDRVSDHNNAQIVQSEDGTAGSHLLHLHSVDSETFEDVNICEDLTQEQKQEVQRLVIEYQDTLTDKPGKTSLVKHVIRMKDNNDTFRQKAYVLPQAMKPIMDKEVQQLLELGIIEKSNSEYHSPCMLVKKPNGSFRFVFDARMCNAHSKMDAEPMNDQKAIEEEFAQCHYFSILDASSGFFQIELDKDSRKYTAFSAGNDTTLYQFQRLPFGLHSSTATWCRLMRIVLDGAKDTKNFVDDVIVFTSTWTEHMSALRDLFKRFKEANLTAKPSKTKIGYSTIEFLGHVIGKGNKEPQPEKIKAILNAVRPSTVKVMQSFLGLVGYYRAFIPEYAERSAPLVAVTRKDMPKSIAWNQGLEDAFTDLKQVMGSKPILKLPDFNKDFMLETDASGVAISGILLQVHDGVKFPVTYISRKLNSAEVNYSTIEQECLALVVCCKKLKYYLLGRHFTILTDHKPLVYLNKCKHSDNARLTRWSLELQHFNFNIKPIKGILNFGADFLSRSCASDEDV